MMDRKRLFSLFALLFLFFIKTEAQGPMPGKYNTMDEKAIKHFESALNKYKGGDDKGALEDLDKAEKRDPGFSEVYELRANIFVDHRENEKAIEQYQKLFAHNPRPHWQTFFTCANIEFHTGHYEEAKAHYERFLQAPNMDPDMELLTRQNLASCKFASEAIKQPVKFNPVNMGPNINTNNHEYFPAITVDGNKFLFTRNFRVNGQASQEDFYCSEKKDGQWQMAQPIKELNTPYNEGAPCFSADGKILFFASCSEGRGDNDYGPTRRGYGSCDIFYCVWQNGHWSQPQNVGPPVCTSDWETQPSFSSDGKDLYFVRGHVGKNHMRENGHIYVSHLSDDGQFMPPVKLNDNINSPGSEESVFIHPDNMTLYFASNGHVGMGGLDIYMSRRQPNGDWGEAVNLGYPINTCIDENSFLVDPTGKIAYFSSERPGGFGGLDFYTFELPENLRPEKITYFKGKIYDAVSKKPLEASFELIDLETQKSLYTSLSDKGSGEFFMTLPSNKNYMLNVSRPGYLSYSGNFFMKDSIDKTKPYLMDVPLQPIDVDKVEILKNVFFETDKYDLKPESKAELNKLVLFLNNNKTLKIELRGHTDNKGDKKKNLVLSDNRAKAVMDYLIANGIVKERLAFKGFGDTVPVVANDTDEHRQLNRRTEYKITAK
jgi:outer membrane protein OmpA-like peptidoglycan-associated protein/Tfp pilus assembly protein PilF